MSTARVAIVGAGAAGIAAAVELMTAGMEVVVFEQRPARVGGVWIHEQGGAMYCGLRTNLPKEVMGYIGHPYDTSLPSFVGHATVADYLEDYSRAQSVDAVIQYSHSVTAARPVERSIRAEVESMGQLQRKLGREFLPWHVTVLNTATSDERIERFDALVVCNGHFAIPDSPTYPGLCAWPGRVLHSVEYDDPADFAGQTVLVVGSGPSGTDIAWELRGTAMHVAISQRSLAAEGAASLPPEPPASGRATLSRYPAISTFHGDGKWAVRQKCWSLFSFSVHNAACACVRIGTVEFVGGSTLAAVDAVIMCTGYLYTAPAIQLPSSVPDLPLPTEAVEAGESVDGSTVIGSAGRMVNWLWRHFLHVHVPSLSFIGLPYGIIPCQLIQAQVLWLVALYSGALQVPPKGTLVSDVAAHYASIAAVGGWPRHVHRLGDGQWVYNRELLCEALATQPERQAMYLQWLDTNHAIYEDVGKHRAGGGPGGADTYRGREYSVDRETGEWIGAWGKETLVSTGSTDAAMTGTKLKSQSKVPAL